MRAIPEETESVHRWEGEPLRHSLEAYRGNCLVFASDAKWLHPLFELEEFIRTRGVSGSELMVYDKIVGRAAALLLVNLCVSEVVAELLSVRAQEVLEYYRVPYRYRTLVERILCRTEELLADELDPAKAHAILLELRSARGRTGAFTPPAGA